MELENAGPNEWAAIVIALSNDCMAGHLTWEEYRRELAVEAKRLGIKFEE